MCTHAVSAMKNEGLHDEAVLSLLTISEYVRKCPNAPTPVYNPVGDAEVIVQFLKTHLPHETMENFKRIMECGYDY